MDDTDDIITETPPKPRKIKDKTYKHKSSHFVHYTRNEPETLLQFKGRPLNVDPQYNKPHLYTRIEDLCGYNNKYFPSNNNVQVIALYDDDYLVDLEPLQCKIGVVFCDNSVAPSLGTIISAFGFVSLTSEFKPIVNVKFYKVLTRQNADKYIVLLEKRNVLVPDNMKDFKSFSLEMTVCSENDLLQCNSDSIFIRNMSVLDELCN